MCVSHKQLLKTVKWKNGKMEKVLGKVNVFFLTVFIIRHHFPKSKRFLLNF